MSEIPPLRISNTDGTFNQIPVFHLELSGGTLTKLSPTKVRLAIAGGQGPSGPAGTITIGSGISAASAGYVLYVSGALLGQVSSAYFVNTGLFLTAGSGLSGGGNLGADRRFDVNENVRMKFFGFFGAGNISTAMLVEEARIPIPFNMECTAAYITATTGPTGADLIVNLVQWNNALTASTAIWAAANRLEVSDGQMKGLVQNFDIKTLYAGSWLGLQIDQVGSTIAGSNLTVTLLVRTS